MGEINSSGGENNSSGETESMFLGVITFGWEICPKEWESGWDGAEF